MGTTFSGMAFDALCAQYNRKTGARQLGVSELRERLRLGKRTVLLDTRLAEERAVSHIAGSIALPPVGPPKLGMSFDPRALAAAEEAVRDARGCEAVEAEEVMIVAYCTVGYRSGFAARTLEQRLGAPVYSLCGGIIAHQNEEGVLVEPGGEETRAVHPYGAPWARFVRNGECVSKEQFLC